MGRIAQPKPAPPPNPIRNQKRIKAPTPIRSTKKKAKRACPNKECENPRIEDGICVECGTIVDDSNIVSEVQFGENSNGGATVQGSYLAEGQGANRMTGPIAARIGGNGPTSKLQTETTGKLLDRFILFLVLPLEDPYANSVQSSRRHE